MYLEKKCFTVSIGDGKFGDTGKESYQDYQEIRFLRELIHSAFSMLVLRWQHGDEKRMCGIGTVNG